MLTHAHITSWLITIVLFFLAVSMERQGAGKAKIVQMVLRLFYILTIATGGLLLHSIASISALYWLKALAGLWVIGAMEMVLAAVKKGKSAAAGWTQWVIALVVTLFLGLLLTYSNAKRQPSIGCRFCPQPIWAQIARSPLLNVISNRSAGIGPRS